MFDQIMTIATSTVSSFLRIWPYLLVTIPVAVAVRMSGASKYISRALQARPVLAIFLATAVGAFSPFCSCGVVPVVAALLISGVPLAPVMSFWIASPSMDPEIFFLSVATLGWELAVWRLAATLVLSLGAGLVTHFVAQQGWLGPRILRSQQSTSTQSDWNRLQVGWRRLKRSLSNLPSVGFGGAATLPLAAACCSNAGVGLADGQQLAIASAPVTLSGGAVTCEPSGRVGHSTTELVGCGSSSASSCSVDPGPLWRRLLKETRDATWMVLRFMLLAFLLSALTRPHVPSEWIAGVLDNQNP